jgi:hypothetical protein
MLKEGYKMAILVAGRTIMAPLENVWTVAGDFTKCPVPAWPIEIARQGDPSNYGIGCERLVRDNKATYHERLEAVDPYQPLTYVMLSGAPVKRYIGKVELSPEGEYTHVRWSVDIAPKAPGTGWIVNLISKKNLNRFLDELEKSTKV